MRASRGTACKIGGALIDVAWASRHENHSGQTLRSSHPLHGQDARATQKHELKPARLGRITGIRSPLRPGWRAWLMPVCRPMHALRLNQTPGSAGGCALQKSAGVNSDDAVVVAPSVLSWR